MPARPHRLRACACPSVVSWPMRAGVAASSFGLFLVPRWRRVVALLDQFSASPRWLSSRRSERSGLCGLRYDPGGVVVRHPDICGADRRGLVWVQRPCHGGHRLEVLRPRSEAHWHLSGTANLATPAETAFDLGMQGHRCGQPPGDRCIGDRPGRFGIGTVDPDVDQQHASAGAARPRTRSSRISRTTSDGNPGRRQAPSWTRSPRGA